MAAIKVRNHHHIDRAWTKDITFTYVHQGLNLYIRKPYHVHLLWDEHEGYTMWWFKDADHKEPIAEPAWVKTFQPNEGDDGQYNLAIQLDALCIDKGEGLIVKHTNNRLNTTELESL
jgi:hypothetical protein